MEKKFCLVVDYGTGSVAMLVNTSCICQALEKFKKEYAKRLPDSKMYGLPDILGARLIPLMYESKYKENKK